MNEDKNCRNCGYKEENQGTHHINCKRNFVPYSTGTFKDKNKKTEEKVNIYIDYTCYNLIKVKEKEKYISCIVLPNRWTRIFPLQFDPIWVRVCQGWNEELNPVFVKERSALERLLGIMGSVGRI